MNFVGRSPSLAALTVPTVLTVLTEGIPWVLASALKPP
jgi:hypothetical protein